MLTTQQIGLAKQAGLFIFESVLYFFTVFQWCVEREPCPQTKLVISTSRTAVVRELHFVSYGKCHTVPYHQAETTHPECVRSSKVLLHRQFLPSHPASHLVVPTVSLVSGPPRGQRSFVSLSTEVAGVQAGYFGRPCRLSYHDIIGPSKASIIQID